MSITVSNVNIHHPSPDDIGVQRLVSCSVIRIGPATLFFETPAELEAFASALYRKRHDARG